MIFYAVRHTTTPWNDDKLIQGWSDLDIVNELNEQGIREARELATKLIGCGITTIVSSDLKRAQQTARIINGVLQVKLFIEEGLRECHFGTLNGLTRDQSIEQYGSAVRDQWSNFLDYDFSQFGGETRDQVLGRHKAVIKQYAHNGGGNTLLVGHGRGLWTLLGGLELETKLKVGEIRQFEF